MGVISTQKFNTRHAVPFVRMPPPPLPPVGEFDGDFEPPPPPPPPRRRLRWGCLFIHLRIAGDILYCVVRRHPFCDIIHLNHKIEASVFAQDEDTGLPLKARPDLWVEDHTLVDVKTTDDATVEGFSRTVTSFGYHIQAAHYLEMTGAENFIFVAVERKAPYAVGIYKLDAEWLQAGANLRRKAITLLHECKALDSWPAYPAAVQTLSCPKWVLNKSES